MFACPQHQNKGMERAIDFLPMDLKFINLMFLTAANSIKAMKYYNTDFNSELYFAVHVTTLATRCFCIYLFS